MTEPLVWPPPPDLFAAHDEFLAACVQYSVPNPPLSRLRLTEYLRQETRKDFRYCRTVVNDFCDRHLILMPLPWPASILVQIPLLTHFAAMFVLFIGAAYLERGQSAAATHLEKLAFRHEQFYLALAFAGIFLLNTALLLISIAYRQKKGRAAAAEAVAKFAL